MNKSCRKNRDSHVLIVAAIMIAGCSDAPTPASPDPGPVSTVTSPAAPERPSATHQAERIALDFVDDIRNGKYDNGIPVIAADAELSPPDRVAAFRMLERFIRTQEWTLWFTFVEVVDENEDSVDCYLRGADGGWLVLMLGYHYDVNVWRIDAYEMPEVTFARPENESYAEYVARSVAESKTGAKPYNDGVDGDGRYFIEY